MTASDKVVNLYNDCEVCHTDGSKLFLKEDVDGTCDERSEPGMMWLTCPKCRRFALAPNWNSVNGSPVQPKVV